MGTRAGGFGTRDRSEYFDWVHEELGIIPQIETAAALENVDEIADADGVSALMIGPTDLSLSLGVSKDDDELEEAVDRVVGAARSADCGVGTFVTASGSLQPAREKMNFVVYSSDAGLVKSALERATEH